MFIINILKLLFIAVFAYIIYNLFRLVFYIGKSSQGQNQRNNRDKKKKNIDGKKGSGRSKKQVIELDKDQYKVE